MRACSTDRKRTRVRWKLTIAALIPLVLGTCGTPSNPRSKSSVFVDDAGTYNWLMFHGDRARTGWNSNETVLTPANVSSSSFGVLWSSPAFDSFGGTPAHMYASPLYVDDVTLSTPDLSGRHFSVVIAATSNSYVYAVNAFDAPGVPAGTILWRRFLGTPGGGVDGARLGVLGTPAIDLAASPPRIYVASDVSDGGRAWRLYILDLTNGNNVPLPNLPIVINQATVSPVNQNPPGTFEDPDRMSQRGGLNLSNDGTIVYVPFGGYSDQATGWMVAIDTGTVSGSPAILSSFGGGHTSGTANGGMWASGGPSIDAAGNVFVVTGNSPTGPNPGSWGQSVLRWRPGVPLQLTGTYTPWNHCQLDDQDIDLCGSGVTLVPDLDPTITSTSSLMAVGGKQGNAYLIDRVNLAGALDQRPACNRDNPTANPADTSLWDPNTTYSWYNNHPGPLSVFGPYRERDAQGNQARARSTPAFFVGADGTNYLFYTGATKSLSDITTPVPPCIARIKINTPGPGQPAFFSVDATENTLAFKSPGTPVVTSNGSSNPIVWIVEPNVYRGDSLAGNSRPALYAVDAMTMQVLYSSPAGTFTGAGGKYYDPIVSRGTVFVGVDRITAFGISSSAGVTVVTNADAHVRGGVYADQNFGTATQLNVKNNPDPDYNRDAYFKFDLTGLPASASAKLRVFGNTDDGSAVTFSANAVADSSWSETAITYNNRPPLGATVSGQLTASGTAEIWYEFDVTSYIQGELAAGHTVTTIALHAVYNPSGGTRINLHSRRSGSNAAQLAIVPAAAPSTLVTTADAHVRSGTYADQNFGTATQINVKNTPDPDYNRDAYFKFDLSSVATVSNAKLRVFGNTDDGTAVIFSASAVVDSSWSETGITYNNRPPLGATISSQLTASGTAEAWYEFDVTSYIQSEKAAGHNITTIALHAAFNPSDGTRINLRSREVGTNPPQLAITR